MFFFCFFYFFSTKIIRWLESAQFKLQLPPFYDPRNLNSYIYDFHYAYLLSNKIPDSLLLNFGILNMYLKIVFLYVHQDQIPICVFGLDVHLGIIGFNIILDTYRVLSQIQLITIRRVKLMYISLGFMS